MSSINPGLIDVTKPEEGSATTASVRANEQATKTNFQAADAEIDALNSGLSGHIADFTNPHQVTAAQAGAPASDPTGIPTGGAITNIVTLTQAAYDGLTPDATTLYLITG